MTRAPFSIPRAIVAAAAAACCTCAVRAWALEAPLARTAVSVFAPVASADAFAPTAASGDDAVAARGGAWDASSAITGSPLALPSLATGGEPELLAQRSIDREWGPSEDSVYAEVDMPGWKSPNIAMGLSAAIPGAGQIYSGEKSGWIYAAVEAASWVSYAIFRTNGNSGKKDAKTYAGDPYDPNSRWSFQTYRDSTGQSTRDLEALYASDPDVFYDTIGKNDTFLKGWGGQPTDTRNAFDSIWSDADADLRRARGASNVIWVNHLVSAFDALRAARIHNLPIERNVNVKFRTSWHKTGPELGFVLERKF